MFAGILLLFGGVELPGCDFLGPRFVGNNALGDLFGGAAHPRHERVHAEHLPRAHNPVVESVDDVEDVRLAEAHLPFIRVVVVKVGFDVKRISPLKSDDLIVFVSSILSYQVDLILQREQEENRLLPRHAFHVHVVHFEDFVSGLETLLGRRRSGLHGRDENTDLVAAGQTNANAAGLFEADEPRVGQRGVRIAQDILRRGVICILIMVMLAFVFINV